MLYFLIRMIVRNKKVTREFNVNEYKCKICGASFQHLVNFRLHQENHKDNGQNECCKFFRI